MQFTTTAEDMHAAAMNQEMPECELAIANAKIAAMQDLIDSLHDSFEMINEYWDGDERDESMRDACHVTFAESKKALKKIKPFLSPLI